MILSKIILPINDYKWLRVKIITNKSNGYK